MGAIPTSPAVVFLEKDNSAYPPNIDSSVVGLVGFATKGPTDQATLITSQENLIQTFGNPSESLEGQGLEGALEILETTNQIRYVRAIPSDAKNASSTVQFGACPAILFAASGFGLSSNLYLKVNLVDQDGVTVLSDKTYSIPSSTTNTSNGLTQASALAKIFGTGDGTEDKLSIIFDSSNDTSGYLVATYAGRNAYLNVSAFSSTTYTTAGLCPSAFKPVTVSDGTLGSFTSFGTFYGLDLSSARLSYQVQSLYQGTGYNLSSDLNTGQTLGNSITVQSGGGAKSLLNVNNDGISSETYKVSLLNDSTFIENVINVGTTNAVSDFIKGEIYVSGAASTNTPLTYFSDTITGIGVNNVIVVDRNNVSVTGATPRFVKLKNGTYNLSGGTNGTMSGSTGTTAITGSQSSKTGMYALDDDLLNISMAAVPGIFTQSVQNALVTLAETSQNFLAVVAPPFAIDTVEEATDWMNGRDSTYRTAAINSSWAAVFWPHVQVFDVFSAKDRWYDPAIFALRQMAFTDNVAETWFAPAGFRRGRLTKPTATEVPLNQGDRDSLYTNNINPIVNFSPEGITIFGQKTAQRAATSLDRINVRRLMIYLRKVLLQTGRIDLFEPNDEFTWDIIKDKAEALLSDIQARRGITDFRVICDSTVNTPVRVDRNELWCKILIKPTKTAEWIIFEVNLTNQSAKFSG